MSLAIAPAGQTGLPTRIGAAAMALTATQRGRYAPWLSVSLGAGVIVYFAQGKEPGSGALLAAAALAILAAALGRGWRAPGWLAGLTAAGSLGFGVAAWHASRMPPPLALPFGAVIVSGTVAEVEALPEGRRVTLSAPSLDGGEPLPRHLRVRLRADDPARPEPGQRLSLRAVLREPGAPVAPGAWDFQRAAFFSGLGGSGFALGPAGIEDGGGGDRPFAALRLALDARIRDAISGPGGAVAAALVTGSQGAIPAAEMATMRDSGLAHLLSVSGLHMTIVMGLSFAVLRVLFALLPWVALRVPGKACAALGALAAGAGYMMLTGAQVPMQRCLAMAALVTLALLAGRRALSMRVIALAAAAVILVAPAELLGPSFQMSFAAVLALIAGYEALRPHLSAFRQRGGLWRRAALVLGGLVLTSVLAGAATTPFGVHHFGRLQIYGVVANAVAVPLTSLMVMPAGMLALALMPFGLEAAPLAAMGFGVELILGVAALVAAWPGAAPALPPVPTAALAAAAFGFVWLCLWRGALRWPGAALVAAALAWGAAQPPPDVLVSADGRLIAIRTEEGVFLHRLPGATTFTRDAMLRRLGVTDSQALPERGEAAGGAVTCTPTLCRFRARPGGAEVALLRTPPPARGARRGTSPDPTSLAETCGSAAILLATEPIRPRCASGSTVDRFSLWRDGAHAIHLTGGSAAVLSDRAWRGSRPWVPPVPLPGRPELLPLAPIDAIVPSAVRPGVEPSR